jgi:hypothetical protein
VTVAAFLDHMISPLVEETLSNVEVELLSGIVYIILVIISFVVVNIEFGDALFGLNAYPDAV